MTLLSRLFLLVVIALLPAIGIQAYGVMELREERRQAIVEQAQRLLAQAEVEQVRVFESVRSTLNAISEAPFLTNGLTNGEMDRCSNYLRRLSLTSSPDRTVSVVDAGGTVLCSGTPGLTGGKLPDGRVVDRALSNGDFVVGARMRWRHGDKAALSFALPYRDRSGVPAGAVVMTLTLDAIQREMERLPLPEGAALTLADHNGAILVRLPDEGAGADRELTGGRRALMHATRPGVAEFKGSGDEGSGDEPRLVAYSPLGHQPADIFTSVGFDAHSAGSEVERGAWIGILTTLAGLVVSLALAWLGAVLFIRRPVDALTRAAEDWRNGASGARARVADRTSEIGRLGDAFDAMAEALEAREEDLRSQERRLRDVLDSLPAFVAVLDAAGVARQSNRAALTATGAAMEEVVGRPIEETPWWSFSLEARERMRAAVDAAAAGETVRFDTPTRVADGRLVVMDVTVSPMRDSDGRVGHLVVTALDITERRRSEDAARAAREEAERANVAKSRFLAAASHDLRQPVQSLLLFVGALGDQLKDHPAAPLAERAGEALGALKRLLDGLLDMSRLESGRVAAAPAPLPLGGLLRQLAAEYAPRARQMGLRFRMVDTACWIHSDPALLERILRNLIENALRYTRSGGVLVGCRRVGDRLRVEVHDTGVGIPADRLDAIFEEFTQLDARLLGTGCEAAGMGMGLGLAIVKRLSSILGHPLAVRSTPGRGSAFSVEAPRVPAPSSPVRVRVPANDGDEKGLVLVIDDEAVIFLGLKAMLESWGYDVITARSADQAVERLRQDGRRPRMVLADYQLQEGRTGPEAMAAVSRLFESAIPGVILTGDTTPERLGEVRSSGLGILHKPVFPSDLRKVIARGGER